MFIQLDVNFLKMEERYQPLAWNFNSCLIVTVRQYKTENWQKKKKKSYHTKLLSTQEFELNEVSVQIVYAYLSKVMREIESCKCVNKLIQYTYYNTYKCVKKHTYTYIICKSTENTKSTNSNIWLEQMNHLISVCDTCSQF